VTSGRYYRAVNDTPAEVSPPAPDHRRSVEADATLARARKRRRLALLVPPAALLAIFLIGEIVARISGARAVSGFVAAGERGWAPTPGRREYDGVPATITEFGTRGSAETPGGVLVVGDETVFGAGLNDQETIGAALAGELQAHVVLAACEGYGFQQKVLWIREAAKRVEPTVVVAVYSFDDPRPFAATIFTSLRFRLQSFSALAATAFPGSRPATRAELPGLYDPQEVPWRLFQQTMRELGDWSKKTKTPVLLAIWPFSVKDDEGLLEYYQQVRGEAKMNGIDVKNVREDLGAGIEALRGAGGKWNAEAMRRAARGIAEALKEGQ